MRTFAKWKAILSKDFLELKRIEVQYPFPRIEYAMKEQEIGQHCCEAGEYLTDAELCSLQQLLGLNVQQWRAHRGKVRPEPERYCEDEEW